MPVMVDFWPRPPERSYPDLLLKKLRPGDIHTHVFAQQFPILAQAWQGQRFHVRRPASGASSSTWATARAASGSATRCRPSAAASRPIRSRTDLHMGNVNGPVVGMLNTMSKFLSMGMPLAEVICRSTVDPAREIGRPELGTLSAGRGGGRGGVPRAWRATSASPTAARPS